MSGVEALFLTFFTLVFVIFAASLFAVDYWCNAPRRSRQTDAASGKPAKDLSSAGEISPA